MYLPFIWPQSLQPRYLVTAKQALQPARAAKHMLPTTLLNGQSQVYCRLVQLHNYIMSWNGNMSYHLNMWWSCLASIKNVQNICKISLSVADMSQPTKVEYSGTFQQKNNEKHLSTKKWRPKNFPFHLGSETRRSPTRSTPKRHLSPRAQRPFGSKKRSNAFEVSRLICVFPVGLVECRVILFGFILGWKRGLVRNLEL